MELEFQPRTMPYLRQTLRETQNQEQTLESIVPDSLPDVDRILCGNAIVTTRNQELSGGEIMVNGGIQTRILYMAEGETAPRCLEAYLPFTVNTSAEGLPEDTAVFFLPRVRFVDARMLNPRKILVRVNYCYTLEAYTPAEATFYEAEDLPEQLQVYTAEYPMQFVKDVSEKSFSIREEIQLPPGKPLGDAILTYEPTLEVSERRLAGNKAAFKGYVDLQILYLCADGSLASHETRFPFSQYCELLDVYEDGELDVTLTMTGCELDRLTRADGDELLLDLDLQARCVVSCRETVTFLEDAYCLRCEMEPTWQEYTFTNPLDRQTISRTVREEHSGSVGQIVQAQVLPDDPEIRRVDGGVEIAVPATTTILYYDENGQLQSMTVRSRMAERLPAAEDVTCRAVSYPAEDVTVTPTADGVELRYLQTMDVTCSATEEFRSLQSCRILEDQAKAPSRSAVIARRSKRGETLWQIAKESGTTVERIRTANGLDGDLTAEDTLLLIPV